MPPNKGAEAKQTAKQQNKLNIISYLDMDKQHITTTSNLSVKRKIILQV
jgi:hypothetical protein